MTDIQTKYQKLAAEYAKVRSQVPVLKKAVLEEQAKEEVRKDEIKTKDQAIRKFEQEVDSLTFRNQQLSARVSVLQEELGSTVVKSKKQKKLNHTLPEVNHPTNSVLSEELQNKIEENATLHRKLQDLDDDHKNEMDRLQARLTQLELDAGSHQHELDHNISEYTQQLHKLREDKVVIEVKLQKKETDKKDSEQKLQHTEEELSRVKSKLSTELAQAKLTIRQKILFNDACNSTLKSLDLPVYNREHQLRCKELISQMYVLVHDFVHAVSSLYTYMEHRVTSYPKDSSMEPLSQNTKALCKYLHENASHLRPVEQAYKEFCESVQDDMVTSLDTMNGIQPVSSTFNRAVTYISKLLPYQILSLEEENSASMCSRSLQAKNKEFQSTYSHLEAVLSKVDTSLTAVVLQSSPGQGHPVSSHPKLLYFLSKSVADLAAAFEAFTKHFRAKMNLEHELPTFTEKLKLTNDCIMSTLLALVNVTGKMDKFFKTNMEFFCQPVVNDQHEDLYVKTHPTTAVFRQRSSDFMASLATTRPESVPYSTALHNRKTLYSSTESRDTLALQVVALQEKLNKTEQEKEHWMLETKLIQMKYEKECQKLEELQKRLGTPGSPPTNTQDTPVAPASPTTPGIAPGGSPVITVLGRLERSMSEEREVEAREHFIKEHYTEKIAQMMVKLQAADSKALNFHAECRALHKRLLVTHCDKDKLQVELEKAQQNVAQLKDELQVTTRNYEGQLSMMSEHLAGMNEKLTTQTDEINGLKYQIQQQTKSTKRSFLGK